MATLAEFKAMFHEITTRVNVLIQQAENYYYKPKLMAARRYEPGGQTFLLIWRTIGFEIAARLYRLLERDARNHHLQALSTMLKDDALLLQMLPSYNRTGKRTEAGLRRARNAIVRDIKTLQKSRVFARMEIFRIRFVAHRQPEPRHLKRLPRSMQKNANVQNMKAADIRELTERVSDICVRIGDLIAYSNFSPETTASLARRDAKDLWEPAPPDEDMLAFLGRKSDA